MRKQLAVHVWLLRANGVHPVSDGTGGTYLLLLEKKGRVERDLGARKAEPFIAGQYPTQPYCVVASKAKSLSLGNCKVFGANLLLLVFAQKLPEHKVQSFIFPFYSLK